MDHALNPIDGNAVAYRTWGSGPPVVLVHGTALSQAIWRGFGYVQALAAEHRVVTLDLRGHGRSGKPHDAAAYAMDRFVADVVAVLDVLRIERAAYVGYSLGGRVGFSLADTHPDRVSRFVSVAGAPGNRPGAFDRVFFPHCVRSLDAGGMPGFLAEWEADSGHPLDVNTKAAFAANDAEALAAYMREADLDTGVPVERLKAFAPDTLLLVGEDDAERLAAAKYVQANAPSTELMVVRGAGHGDVLRTAVAREAIVSFVR